VFTLWPINVADHAGAWFVAMKALRLAGLFSATELYMSENGIGGQTSMFDPDLYVDISDVIEAKRKMVDCHASQHANADGVLERNRIRGRFAGCEYAEGFKVYKPLMGARGDRKNGYLLLDL
jgi:LmbE family N-acetylglucosaminyl deacetylase